MGTVVIAALGGAAAALLLVALVAVLRRSSRGRADLEAMLAAAQRESDDLRVRLEALTAQFPAQDALPEEAATYVITDAGQAPHPLAVPETDQVQVPDRLVLTATVGKPLVKVAAFGYGVRRALSPENRNRIWFEMRREVRTARKRRKQLLKQYQRDLRAAERANEGLA